MAVQDVLPVWRIQAGWLSMGKTARRVPRGEVLTIYQLDRSENQVPRLMVFIPKGVAMSMESSPMRHSLLHMRPWYLRRTPADVCIYTAAYILDDDGSHWRGFRREWSEDGQGVGLVAVVRVEER